MAEWRPTPRLPMMTGPQIWDWARAYASAGYTATAALAEVRISFRVPEKPWYATFREAFAVEGYRESIKAVPMSYIIPEAMFAVPPEPKDWTEEWNLINYVRYYDPSQQQWVSQYIQVESDVLLTKAEWRGLVEEWLTLYHMEGRYDPTRGYTVEKYEAVRRVYP